MTVLEANGKRLDMLWDILVQLGEESVAWLYTWGMCSKYCIKEKKSLLKWSSKNMQALRNFMQKKKKLYS